MAKYKQRTNEDVGEKDLNKIIILCDDYHKALYPFINYRNEYLFLEEAPAYIVTEEDWVIMKSGCDRIGYS